MYFPMNFTKLKKITFLRNNTVVDKLVVDASAHSAHFFISSTFISNARLKLEKIKQMLRNTIEAEVFLFENHPNFLFI